MISGDALCDIDILQAVEYHRQNRASATIVLKKMGNPLEYGVVIQRDEGSVERFVEKPGWEDVFSDTVNTGLYVLEPEVLRLVPDGQLFDFAKDVFPLMMEKGWPIFGYVADGYWCDVGNIESYIKAHEDLLKGAVKAEIRGKCAGGIYVGEGADLSNSALIQSPSFIGEGAVIGEGAKIGSFSSVGQHVRVGAYANIKRSILLAGASVGRQTKLSSCVVGAHSTIGERCSVFEGAVIGDRCRLAGDNSISPHVKLWPEKWIAAGVSVGENIVWGYGERAGFLSKAGFAGDIGADLTPLRLGRIFGAAAEYMSGKSVALCSDNTAFGNAALKQAIGIFTMSGVDVYAMHGVTRPVCAYIAHVMNAGLCVSIRAQKQIKLYVDLFEPELFMLSKQARKKIEAKYFTQGEQLADLSCGKETWVGAADSLYVHTVYEKIDRSAIKAADICVLVRGGKDVDAFAARVFRECDIRVKQQQTDIHGPIGDVLREEHVDFAVRMSRNASFCTLYLPDGGVIGTGEFQTLVYYLIMNAINTPRIKLPSGISRSVIHMAEIMGLECDFVSEQDALRNISLENRRMLFDGTYAVCRLVEHIARTGARLEEIAAMIAPAHVRVRELSCDWEDMGRVIRTVYDSGEAYANEGVRFEFTNGYGYICPHSTHPKIVIRTEGDTEEFAKELCEKYTGMVRRIIKK